MKANILSALIAAALAFSATAQDYGSLILNHQIVPGMTFGDVVAAWGQPLSIDHPLNDAVKEYWHYPGERLVMFDNGRVWVFLQPNSSEP
jgi:hypothetical protein